MSRKIELVLAALFALFFIFWPTFDVPVAPGLVNESAGCRGLFRYGHWLADWSSPLVVCPRSNTSF
jgi:hypothetical protein